MSRLDADLARFTHEMLTVNMALDVDDETA
jgi:hypothetical protein